MAPFLLSYSYLEYQGNNEGKLEQYQLAEIKHSRLAMIAFSGFVHQYFITKQLVFEQLSDFKAIPGACILFLPHPPTVFTIPPYFPLS